MRRYVVYRAMRRHVVGTGSIMKRSPAWKDPLESALETLNTDSQYYDLPNNVKYMAGRCPHGQA
jgi:hypothetical protein